jgi:hypothetical protein
MNAPRVTDEWEVDDLYFPRWNWVIDEMIWSFEQLHVECDFGYKNLLTNEDISNYHIRQKRIQNGFRLFGTYYQNLWD